MAKALLTVVVSQGQSRNPEKRDLERLISEKAATLPGIHVLVIPHLYDLTFDGETFAKLRELDGDLVVLSWLYDRATHWVLDRNGVRGQFGEVLLKPADYQPDAEDDEEEEETSEEVTKDRVSQTQPRPQRNIYCIDLRASEQSESFINEIDRLLKITLQTQAVSHPELNQWLAGSPSAESLLRYLQPNNDVGLSGVQNTAPTTQESSPLSFFGTGGLTRIDEHPSRRWYPVIDFSRCTNCMECIDFCLFGVYGVDRAETILVEQPDNWRKGCPACSRVCPENAIIFPQHKTPAIAGAPVEVGGLKIDRSKLFGAPESDEDALAVAARERDEQLLLAGREAVGTVTRTKSTTTTDKSNQPKDELDSLIDQLDQLDL